MITIPTYKKQSIKFTAAESDIILKSWNIGKDCNRNVNIESWYLIYIYLYTDMQNSSNFSITYQKKKKESWKN